MSNDDEKVADARIRLEQPPLCKECSIPMDWTSLEIQGVQMHWCCPVCGLLYSVTTLPRKP